MILKELITAPSRPTMVNLVIFIHVNCLPFDVGPIYS